MFRFYTMIFFLIQSKISYSVVLLEYYIFLKTGRMLSIYFEMEIVHLIIKSLIQIEAKSMNIVLNYLKPVIFPY